MNNFFSVKHVSKNSKARLGEIKTDYGTMKTPAFISAATKGTIKTISPQLIKEIGIQGACVNTYHLVTHPGADIIAKAGGIHKYSGLNMPLMSDSGGFQVFSLARTDKDSRSQFLSQSQQKRKNSSPSSLDQTRKADVRGDEHPILVKISEDGVKFRSTFDGALIEFTPERSMEFQRQIGADINMAFDECTYYPATHEYAEKAMKRTHEWLIRCIRYKDSADKIFNLGSVFFDRHTPKGAPGDFQKTLTPRFRKNFSPSSLINENSLKNEKFKMKNSQYLYGVIQGGTFEDLRKKSAEFVVSQNTPGVAIGGVSVGESKKEMRDQVSWVSDYLPLDRPVHLLGVGQIDDIVDLVKYGIDTFDCVEPTRLARMGSIYQISKIKDQNDISKIENNKIDITKTIYKNSLEKVDEDCICYVCKNFTKSYLHHLFKQREILGYTLATYHNLWVMEKFFERIRELISINSL